MNNETKIIIGVLVGALIICLAYIVFSNNNELPNPEAPLLGEPFSEEHRR